MDRIIRGIEQGSPEWMALRIGKIGGSRVADVLTEGRGGAESLTRRKYKNELIRERLTGKKLDTYKTPAMQRGIDLEPMARAWYEVHYNTFVDQVAIVLHPSIEGGQCSPDGIVESTNSLIEIKIPNPENHLDNLLTGGKQLEQYYDQVQWQLACMPEKEFCDLISYDPDMPDHLQGFVKRIYRDDEYIQTMQNAVIAFLSEIETIVINLKENKNGNNT
ncbi:diguanylate cyclase/phosphodiesterase [Methylophilaceae phage P19250A]|nr:diguanylate cyclase/phosphodiesterase [Methylophilaceae phage P19250A]